MKCQILFSRKKNKKTVINLSSAELGQSVGKVKLLSTQLSIVCYFECDF